MAYTSDDIILWGKISQPYAARGEAKKRATRGATVDTDLHIKLYVERKTVEWYNNQSTQDADILYTISNFLFSLEGVYGLQAQFIDGGSGGQVVPITPSTTDIPDDIDWEVGATADGDSPLANGQSSVTLNGTAGMPDLRGYNIDFFRGGITQNTTPAPDGVSTYYSWNRDTGLLQLYNGLASTGELMRISPDIYGGIVTTTSNQPETIYLTGDGTYTLVEGYMFWKISIKPTAADTVRIGTTANGEEVMMDKLMTVNVYGSNGVNADVYADGSSQTIYFTGFTATAQINIYLLPI